MYSVLYPSMSDAILSDENGTLLLWHHLKYRHGIQECWKQWPVWRYSINNLHRDIPVGVMNESMVATKSIERNRSDSCRRVNDKCYGVLRDLIASALRRMLESKECTVKSKIYQNRGSLRSTIDSSSLRLLLGDNASITTWHSYSQSSSQIFFDVLGNPSMFKCLFSIESLARVGVSHLLYQITGRV